MYYDIEEETRQAEPSIDEQIKELQKRKVLAKREYEASEKTKEDYDKLNYILLAVAERKNALLEKKYWNEYSRSSSLSADIEHLRKNSSYDFSRMVYCCFLLGFLFACAKDGVPSDFIGILSAIVLSPFFSLFLIIPMVLLSEGGGIIGRHPKISALVLYVITAITIIIAF